MKEIPRIRITESALNEIITYIGGRPAESGGALFSSEDNIVKKFVADRNAKVTGATYTIDHQFINATMKKLRAEGLYISGIIHSHPHGYPSLSGPDREYFKTLLTKNLRRDFFYTPIVHSTQGGPFKIHPYILDSSGNSVTSSRLEIVYDDDVEIPHVQEDAKSNKHNVSKTIARVYAIEVLLFKMLCILWLGWMLYRFLPLPQYILNALAYGTH